MPVRNHKVGNTAAVLLSFVWLNISFQQSNELQPLLPAATAAASSAAPDSLTIPRNYFINPLDLPMILSGNFGEPRRAHFHTGLDFRTNQEEGHKVFAAAAGYVSRINVSAGGYGNALYVTHPNGFVTVYGHLQKFSKTIEARLRKEQYAKESFAVDFLLPPSALPVKQGELIALSGNTGGSGGPHLHFEIRDTFERVYNPMLFDYNLKDNMKPVISFIKFYPMDSLRFQSEGYRLKPVLKEGIYEVTSTLKFNDNKIGFSVNTFDRINLTESTMGIYSMTVFDGNRMIYNYKMDRLTFADRRYVMSHVDYQIFLQENRKAYHKCFVDPGNKCPVYYDVMNAGVVDLSDGKTHKINIEVSDFAGNVSLLKFAVQYERESVLFKPVPFTYTTRFDFDHENEFSNSDIQVRIPKGVLFDHVYFKYASDTSADKSIYSKVHKVHDGKTYVNDWFTISLNTVNLPPELSAKAVVVFKDDHGATASRGGTFKDGFVTAKTREFGTYYVRIDTTAPRITPLNIVAGRNMRTYKKILVKISDNLSGIADFDTYIDGKWVVTEHDGKSATLTHYLDMNLTQGEHIFKVIVEDERKNKAEYSVKFQM